METAQLNFINGLRAAETLLREATPTEVQEALDLYDEDPVEACAKILRDRVVAAIKDMENEHVIQRTL